MILIRSLLNSAWEQTIIWNENYDKSNTYLLKALQTQPDMFPALRLVGSNFLKLGEPEQAVPYLKRAVRIQPADEYANHNLANAEFLAGDYRAAYADYIRFLHVPGRHDDAISWYGFGEIALLLSREVSGQLGDVPTTDPSRLRFLSSVYEELEEWGLAASRLKMLESQPAWGVWAKLHLGQVYLHLPDPPQAVEKFQQVLASDPDSAEAHFGLGVGLLIARKTGGSPSGTRGGGVPRSLAVLASRINSADCVVVACYDLAGN